MSNSVTQTMRNKDVLEVAAGVMLLAVILLLAYRNGQSQTQSASSTPLQTQNPPVITPPLDNAGSYPINVTFQPGNTYDVIVPPATNYSLTGGNIVVGNGDNCSCGCNSSSSFFGMSNLLSAYAAALTGADNAYVQGVTSAFQKFMGGQYFENTTGWNDANTLADTFASLQATI